MRDKRSYSEKLKDPRWQRVRLRVFERDGWACQECGRTDRTLHVHHLRYERGREPWEYPLSDLKTLCEDCHAAEHPDKAADMGGVPWGSINAAKAEVVYAYLVGLADLGFYYKSMRQIALIWRASNPGNSSADLVFCRAYLVPYDDREGLLLNQGEQLRALVDHWGLRPLENAQEVDLRGFVGRLVCVPACLLPAGMRGLIPRQPWCGGNGEQGVCWTYVFDAESPPALPPAFAGPHANVVRREIAKLYRRAIP